MKMESEENIVKKVHEVDSLAKLEAIKTMNWHVIPLEQVFESFNQKLIQSNIDSSYFKDMNVKTFEEGILTQGKDFYLKTGLPNDEKILRGQRENFGSNKLTELNSNPWYKLLWKQFSNQFAVMLECGSVMCFIAQGVRSEAPDNLQLGVVLILLVVITGLFSFYQEWKSVSTMASFKNYVPPKCRVLREGRMITIATEDIVTGDIIDLVSGMRVPADLRVIECSNLSVDNSCLTGECMELERMTEHVELKPLEAKNLMFQGTLIRSGSGRGIAIKVGDETFMGLIAKVMGETENPQTPLAKEIEHFIIRISILAVVFALVFFFIGWARTGDVITNLIQLIGLIVANIPEGLLLCVTVSLTIIAKSMASKNVLVKALESVETLGSTSCICSDKTGTLTQNRMTIMGIYMQNKIQSVVNKLDTNAYNITDKSFESNDAFKRIVQIGSLCSTSTVENIKVVDKVEMKLGEGDVPINCDWQTQKQLKTTGSATESGIVKQLQPYNTVPLNEQRKNNPIIMKDFGGNIVKLEIPFNSKYKQQASVHKAGNKIIVFCKGAPDRVLDMCAQVNENGHKKPITQEIKDEVMKSNMEFSNLGRRVLAFSYYEVGLEEENSFFEEVTLENNVKKMQAKCDLNNKLIFAGLLALEDPPRLEVTPAIKACHSAGVRVIMVTGDFSLTAQAIAKDIGILRSEPDMQHLNKVISGEEISKKLKDLTKDPKIAVEDVEGLVVTQIAQMVKKQPQMVFARTSPEQKQIIVSACQEAGQIVAVTGDGVNDSPAMKKADIGIAMGIEGTDVAKEASDMILLDDNFASIVVGIMEGRLIFDNLKKTVTQILASNVPEITPVLLYILIGIPIPLSTQLMLCVDIGTDLLPSISMAYEYPESDLMLRKPKDSLTDRMVSANLIVHGQIQIGLVLSLMSILGQQIVWSDYGVTASGLTGLANQQGMSNALIKDLQGTQDLEQMGVWPTDPICKAVRNQLVYVDSQRYCWNSAQNKKLIDSTFSGIGSNFIIGNYSQNKSQDMRAFQVHHPDFATLFKNCIYKDSDGKQDFQCWNSNTNMIAQCAVFLAIVVGQISDILISRTRQVSMIDHGFQNGMILFGIVFEILLSALFIQSPLGQQILAVPVKALQFGVCGFPFCLLIIATEEYRKWMMRKSFYTEGPKAGTGLNWMQQQSYQ